MLGPELGWGVVAPRGNWRAVRGRAPGFGIFSSADRAGTRPALVRQALEQRQSSLVFISQVLQLRLCLP
jgi:hypothetical protein